MNISQYIIVKRAGTYRYTSRMTSKSPSLASGEVAVKVEIQIPDAAFTKPAFEAKLIIPESSVGRPKVEAEVIDNVQSIIKQNLGFDVNLRVIEDEV